MVAVTRSQTRKLAELSARRIDLSRKRCCVCGARSSTSGPLPFPHKTLAEWYRATAPPKRSFLHLSKAEDLLRPQERCTQHQNEVTTSRVVQLSVRARSKRSTHKVRQRNLGAFPKRNAKYSLSPRTVHFMRSVQLPVLPNDSIAWGLSKRLHILQSKPGQSSAQEIVAPNLKKIFSRTRRRRQRGRVPRKVNLGGNSMAGQVEPVLSEEAMRFMLDLSIPTLPSGCDWIQVDCLKHLNWEISLTWAVDSLELSNPNNPTHSSPTANETEYSSGYWIPSPPGQFPLTDDLTPHHRGSDLEKERWRVRDRMLHGSFQIPSDWTPIRDISPIERMGIREGTSNSAVSDEGSPPLDMEGMYKRYLEQDLHKGRISTPPSISRPTNKSGSVSPEVLPTAIEVGPSRDPSSVPAPLQPDFDPLDHTIEEDHFERHLDALWKRFWTTQGSPTNREEIDDNGNPNTMEFEANSSPSPSYDETTVKFIPKLHAYLPTLVHDWEMLVATRHYSFIWRYQEPEAMRTRACSRHVRVFSTSRPPLNSDINLPGATARMAALHGGDPSGSRETGNRYILGHFLADMTATETIPAYCSFRKKTLPGWQCPSTPVLLDIACFPSREALPWDERATPLLLAAQFSEGVGGHDRMAAEPLACAFHSTLVVLILYYLDTRLREEDNLPSWMVVYGIIYTETGFSIHEHYPVYHPRANGQPPRWGGASALAVNFEDVFDPHSPPQSQPISALLRISGHAQFILETLAKWDGYQRIIGSHFIP